MQQSQGVKRGFTVRPRSIDLFYKVTSDIKWVKTSWTYFTASRLWLLPKMVSHEQLRTDQMYFSFFAQEFNHNNNNNLEEV